MHWTYQPADKSQLHQGDILSRTPDFSDLLKEVHPYFESKSDNKYFMILTQTCDLVRRPEPKAEYIAICPVRPLERILTRALRSHVRTSSSSVPVGTQKDQQKFRDFLTRLFNNNESGLFYLENDPPGVADDCVAITRLSISIKAVEHYEKCLAAKVAQLDEPFRAKLGWAVGNIYSRVGTQDWEHAELQEKISSALNRAIVWAKDAKEQGLLLAKLDEAHAAGEALTESKIRSLRKQLKDNKEELVELVAKLMSEVGVDHSLSTKVTRRLKSDPALGSLIKA